MLYLASRSPRRQEILQQMGIHHRVLIDPNSHQHIDDEPQLPQETAADYVIRTAQDKAMQGWAYVQQAHLPALPILSADTCVIYQNEVLGKPRDYQDAYSILSKLSGQTHEVRTAIALYHQQRLYQTVNINRVHFKDLTEDEIHAYCLSPEPYDKAGAYGIQGWAGVFIRHLEGSFTGVMGLPVYELAQLLQEANLSLMDLRQHST